MKKGMFVIIIIAALVMAWVAVNAQENRDVDYRYVGRVEAPEFPEGLDWLNVYAPLTLDGLRGKIIILDFWTYGCINCIHMIPVLEQVEEKFGQEVVVIGVHSAKFENEGQTENLRQIVQRYNLHHPVINDYQFRVWRGFGANAWPTIAIVDPYGSIVALQAGEIPFEAFDQYLSGMIAYYDGLETPVLNRTPLEIALESAGNPGTPLLFPGKVRVDEAGNRLFITDSNHHRIVIANLTTYAVLDIIGRGERGWNDGAYDVAAFNQPQGVAIDGDTLYIADTNNHLIRKVDLAKKEVTTLAGTGRQGRGSISPGDIVNTPRAFDIRSPWDVAIGNDNILHIAMAGTHQLWALNLNDNTLYPTVGNGRESLVNRSFAESELAQPSGLYFVDGQLYFADSESSSIRVADFNTNQVRTLAGPEIGVGDATEQNVLFLFDDVDGPVGVSRLQHGLDVTGTPDGKLFVADTYNSKIKEIDPDTTEIRTVFGQTGNGAYRDGGADVSAFDEPGGIDYANGKLYVADTNNHAIRIIDLNTNTVSTLNFPNVEKLLLARNPVNVVGGNTGLGETIVLSEQAVSASLDNDLSIVLKITLPDGYKINDLIDSTLSIRSDSRAVLLNEAPNENELTRKVDATAITIPTSITAGLSANVVAELTLYYCLTGDEALCFIDEVTYEVAVTGVDDASASTEIVLERTVTPPSLD